MEPWSGRGMDRFSREKDCGFNRIDQRACWDLTSFHSSFVGVGDAGNEAANTVYKIQAPYIPKMVELRGFSILLGIQVQPVAMENG
ncbi:hypothetical protein BSKO_05445 [Bryopsis sp. KO-2023]|nr:hypothetical protein BSKO_05445 [Bryopsis sp. KO-2023]